MAQNIDLVTERWEDFLKRYCWDELVELANYYPEKRSLLVKFTDMDLYDPNLADMVLESPDVAINAATRALRAIDTPTGVTLDEANFRIIKVPRRLKIRDIRSEDIGKLVSIEGLVTKATEVRPKVVDAVFECPYCHHVFSMGQSGRQFKEPVECDQESGGCGRRAQHFKLLIEQCKFANAQKIRLQESPEELRGGELPQAIDVYLEDDITGTVTPGDRVIITGILRSYQRTTRFGKTPFFDIYLEGNSLEHKEEEFEEIKITEEDEQRIMELKDQPDVYEKLIRSIAPSIYGYEEIKEAMVLQLFAGVPKELPDDTRVRGDIHVLLVGDPGVAKSQLLTYLVKLAPRGLYTGGKSSTSAGLTAAAVKDEFGEGRWTLEAGALVLADKGIAAVDEIDKMRKEDRDALHEAMEQQTVSVAKAGIMARLNSRCGLLAAANPKYGRFDKYTPIAEQINMPPTLLSRFDLIFTMMDRPNEETDTKTAEHIIETHYAGELLAQLKNISKIDIAEREHFEHAVAAMKPPIESDLLRKYVAWSKRNVFPVMSEGARRRFLEFYIGLRRQGYEDEEAPVPVTARQLEALIRLGEARARARLSDEITEEDADRVINIVTYCLKRVFVDPETGRLDTDWVTVGITKTKRDRARSIREIIKDLEREYGEEVPLEEVLDLAEEEGMEREKAEEIIEVMKRDGILFSPSSGIIKFVR
ncbi:MAG: minichromosome maintenance protein MCM [Methanophagales archaeon]|nr:minichromosome maintenance protein MCM [Methanophagales archaeon]MCW3139456.1 minichromosome maintenance protein MCM [Methanophagales archaeon]MCW7070355.1 minichromosome maintenance protein MCM [Methanophagales archaeon]MCW7073545.1 minichromosome maintenance protein MCM [Methanophagales archaeon]